MIKNQDLLYYEHGRGESPNYQQDAQNRHTVGYYTADGRPVRNYYRLAARPVEVTNTKFNGCASW